ncbi:aluminum-activated malate transporter 4-like protein [Tanacetum coccineum]
MSRIFPDKSRERLLSRKSYLESNLFSDFGSTNDIKHANSFLDRIKEWWTSFREFCVHGLEMGRSDPKQVIFAAKSGLAIAIVSALLFVTEHLPYISNNIIWAILTVVLVFEFSIVSKHCSPPVHVLWGMDPWAIPSILVRTLAEDPPETPSGACFGYLRHHVSPVSFDQLFR